MKHDFNHKAETFDSPKNIFLANLVCQAVEKQIDILSDKEILDFGGGTGLLALPLAKQAKSVTLVDISEKMLEQARLKVEQQAIKNIQFLEQDLPKNPLEKEFDYLAVSRLLHHMPDLDAALSLFHQHLKEDGKLIIADFTKTEANHHGFDLAELENKLIEHGFSSVHSQILYSAEDLFQGNHSEFFLIVAQKSLA
ncbi:methyltransferase small domain superfamily [Streptococcus pneumoniae]|uniref:Methyltransferase small domain superfamily n=1 Tax=Streptococcus pneumoniae TaxID=1313 RepID=A0A4J2EX00_STREE|nr:class I SAM-dependent methyltransferase [Streptococcus pneumoniae]MDS2346153.1 class I SAM-dependent methyltransferase [Streptococcus pneumoniae]MDS2424947.1 class I SAM-dependent methyltransferase [Streptococcus pneumoniae]MDS2454220.1 class I SAM-dependent methyltransferase [Streptococcus pneumoniae]MDS2820437.1 class I SAM-dependent methyltransferase [Streptococcus pneumoniae]MDS3593719.1 class I SAM-dependent methyltransferase [Streptococcus pneumoniae]